MLRIRLTRVGKKNSPSYRVVVADKKRAVKGKFIEIIGHYNPTLTPKELVINKDRALFWIKQGALPTNTVNNLMADSGVLPKSAKIKKVYGKKLSKKAAKEEVANAGKAPKVEAPKPADEAPVQEEQKESEKTAPEETAETPTENTSETKVEEENKSE